MRGKTITLESLESRVAPATFTVTSVADSGMGTLRQALADADAAPGPDKIRFKLPAPPANSENIILLANQLTSQGNVRIVGPGAGKLIIDGNDSTGILFIDDGGSATDSPTSIRGLSIIHGNRAGPGGGILCANR